MALDQMVAALFAHLLFWLLLREAANVLTGEVRIVVRLRFMRRKRR